VVADDGQIGPRSDSVTRTQSPWIVAAHRFVEVSIGIATGLLLTAV